MLNNYTIKTQKNDTSFNDGKPYIILCKSYYSRKQDKYVENGSLFIDREFALELINLGVRLFDNAECFKKEQN